jgi:hypothetical protein
MLFVFAVIVGAFGVPPPLWICMLLELMLVPQLFVQVAVYVPEPTWIEVCELPLGDQVTVPEQPVAVKVACCVPQILVALADITGAFGVPPPLWI